MANLQVKGIEDALYEEIKILAKSENRSISQQVLYLLKQWLANKKQFQATKTPAEVLLGLSGSWQDVREAENIVMEIRNSRTNSNRYNEIF